MKCDHIRTRAQGDTPFFPNMLNNGNVEVCLKEDVDAAIEELKEANKLLKEHIANGDVSRITWIDEVIELKQKLDEKESWVKMLGEGEAALSLELEKTKQKLHDAEMRADLAEAANTEYRLDIEKIKAENERLKNELKHSEDELESYFIFEKEIKQKLRAARRALYKACANWAHHIVFVRFNSNEKAWENVERKCLKKAEEYK